MPNWKKVITSGSDAAFNSVIASNGFTGSLQGTASYFAETDPIFTAKSASLATTGSNTFRGTQIISGSGQTTILQVHAATSEPWAFGIYNDAYSSTIQGLAGWIDVTGEANIGTEVDKPIRIYTSASYNNPTLIISSSGVTVGAGGITGSLFGTGSWARNAVTASYITGSVFTSTNPALSASFAVTASHALNVSPPVTINNNTDNFIVTATGTSLTVQGEPNFRFNGSLLQLTGSAIISGANASLIVSGTISATNDFVGNLTGTSSWADVSKQVRIGVTNLPVTYSGGSNAGGSYIYHIPVIREAIQGSNPYSLLASTSSLTYSASIDLLMITASWAFTASQAISASYAANAAPTVAEGSTNEIQYNAGGGAFGGVPALTYDGTDLIGTGRFDGNLRLGVFRGIRTSIPTPPSKGDEVLVYTQQITAGTFTDNDVIRVHYRIDQRSSDTSIYRIYIANDDDFSAISGSMANLIANVTASSAVKYVGIKRDLTLDAGTGRMYFMNSGSAATSDDITDIRSVSNYDMDWANVDYWMYFSAIPNQVAHTSKALSYSIERV